MKAVEFYQKFDRGEDIIRFLDLSKAKRSRSNRIETSPDGIDLGKDARSVDRVKYHLYEHRFNSTN